MEQTMQRTRNDTVKGLCMECAMRRHTFNELTGRAGGADQFDYMALPEALIDGRRHVLLSYPWTHQENCADCNRAKPALYVPMRG